MKVPGPKKKKVGGGKKKISQVKCFDGLLKSLKKNRWNLKKI